MNEKSVSGLEQLQAMRSRFWKRATNDFERRYREEKAQVDRLIEVEAWACREANIANEALRAAEATLERVRVVTEDPCIHEDELRRYIMGFLGLTPVPKTRFESRVKQAGDLPVSVMITSAMPTMDLADVKKWLANEKEPTPEDIAVNVWGNQDWPPGIMNTDIGSYQASEVAFREGFRAGKAMASDTEFEAMRNRVEFWREACQNADDKLYLWAKATGYATPNQYEASDEVAQHADSAQAAEPDDNGPEASASAGWAVAKARLELLRKAEARLAELESAKMCAVQEAVKQNFATKKLQARVDKSIEILEGPSSHESVSRALEILRGN